MAVITLLTDFGTRDPYMGIMKGVILGIDPAARLVDLTHEVAPGDAAGAGFILSTAWRWFPEGTVHLAVVDPGVGSERKPMAALADGHYFIGPDNGLFTAILDGAASVQTRELADERYRLEPVSRTFHGRDIFAPAAAWLSRGIPWEDLGPELTSPVRGDRLPQASGPVDGEVRGQVVMADIFGNLITNIPGRFAAQLAPGGEPLALAWEGGGVVSRLVGTYAEAPPGTTVLLVGSSGYLEISVNRGSAAERTGVEGGDTVRLRRHGGGAPGNGEPEVRT